MKSNKKMIKEAFKEKSEQNNHSTPFTEFANAYTQFYREYEKQQALEMSIANFLYLWTFLMNHANNKKIEQYLNHWEEWLEQVTQNPDFKLVISKDILSAINEVKKEKVQEKQKTDPEQKL